LATVIYALNMWRHYLEGQFFLLLADNIALKYMFDKQNLNSRQERWLSFLRKYDLEIKHIKGNANKVADALSRHGNLIYTVTRSNYETDLEERERITTKNDLEY
jgi:hypothetical protein